MQHQESRPTPQKIIAIERRDGRLLPALRPTLERAGWELRLVDDLGAWSASQSSPVGLLSLAYDLDWRRLELLTEQDSAIVLAFLPRANHALYLRAFAAGASAVASAGDSPAHIARVLNAALFEYALVPVAALREPRDHRVALTDPDKVVLRGLADGLTTEEIADRVGCSERTVYRRLRRVRNNLQVRSRGDAVTVAQRLGLLAAPLTPS